jgi:hypothetical protein
MIELRPFFHGANTLKTLEHGLGGCFTASSRVLAAQDETQDDGTPSNRRPKR